MLGEIYLAGALAIFFAVFGWSENIFGFSKETKQKQREFIIKTKGTPKKYKELKELVAKSREMHAGEYLKELMRILKGTTLVKNGKKVFDKIRENENKLLELNNHNSLKKRLFALLFLFLFIVGTAMIIFENSTASNVMVKIGWGEYSLHNILILSSQILLLFILIKGFSIYSEIKNCESLLQNNLTDLFIMEGEINGR